MILLLQLRLAVQNILTITLILAALASLSCSLMQFKQIKKESFLSIRELHRAYRTYVYSMGTIVQLTRRTI